MMKTLMVIVIIILGFNVYSLFVSPVPDAVKNAFEKKFSISNDVTWSKQDSAHYEAQFSMHGIDTQAYFTSNGKWLETQTEIALFQLPKKVIESITKRYPDCSIVDAEKIEEADNKVFYETEIMSPRTNKQLEFKNDGTVYKQ